MIPLQALAGDKPASVSDAFPVSSGDMAGSLFISCRAGNLCHIVGEVFQGIIKVVSHPDLAAGASSLARLFRPKRNGNERYSPTIFCGDDDRLSLMRIGKQLVQAMLSVFDGVGFHLSYPDTMFTGSVPIPIK